MAKAVLAACHRPRMRSSHSHSPLWSLRSGRPRQVLCRPWILLICTV